MKDLFGHTVADYPDHALTPKERRKWLRKAKHGMIGTVPKGYAGTPGKGPDGQTCGTCLHLVRRRYSRSYLKCGLMRAIWTGGGGSDVRFRSPACDKWEKQEGEPTVMRAVHQGVMK